jgi:hypothetical protein
MEDGLGCFFVFSSRVLFALSEDLVVISILFAVLVVIYNTTDN